MPRMRGTVIIGGFVAVLLAASATYAQPNLKFTKIVDPNGNPDANFVFIHDAIDDVPDNTSDKYTILVYAGTYTIDSDAKLIKLDGTKENVDIVGVDGEAVIIDVTIGSVTCPRSGIKITSGTETSRNNVIRNLTIKTKVGRGIEIVKGGGGGDKTPKDISIEGVTILADGADQDGIYASEVEKLRIADVNITTTDGHGIEFVKPGGGQTPKDIEIEGVTIRAVGSLKDGIEGSAADTVRIFDCNIESDGGHGIDVGDNYQIISSSLRSTATVGNALHTSERDGLLVSNCTLTSDSRTLLLTSSGDVEVLGSTIQGGLYAIEMTPPHDNVKFRDCSILAEGNGNSVIGIYADLNASDTTIDPIFQACRIEAIGGTSTSFAHAVEIDNTEVIQFIDCDFRATSLKTTAVAKVRGILCESVSVMVIGGSIETSQPDYDRPIDVFDLEGDVPSPTPDHIFISGTQFSKWIGPINAAGRPRSVMQRTIDVDDEVKDDIHESLTLAPTEQSITTNITDPDVYRVLSVTGSLIGMNQDVYIVGTDWGDNVIVDKITLNGSSTVEGVKPFKTVTKIIVPAQTSGGQSLEVGTTNRLGLYYPISATTDVLQQGRKASGASSYTLETMNWTPEAVYATVDITTITDGDSFEWALLTGQ